MKVVLIFLAAFLTLCDAFRVFEVEGAETLLALENEEVNIECKADTAMAYCAFVHPSGKRFSFSGASLEAGQCSYRSNLTAADSGQWRCHIGRKGSTGLEITKIINVRLTSQLAAIQQNISTVHGKEVTLSCASVDGRAPLRYCRFEPPAGKPFSINSDVTPERPILKRYYFPYNKSLDRGDCAVSIRKVKYEDVGRWSCGAGLDDGMEHLDTILLEVEGLYTMSTASATGITFGAIGIAAFLAILGFVVWKKRRFLGSSPDETEHELQRLPTHRSQESVNEPRSRQGSTHELRPPPSSYKPKSHQGSTSDLGTRQSSTRELRLQPGPAFQSKSRQGSTHDLSTRLQSQTDSSHEPTSHKVLIYEPSAPSSAFESNSHQGSTSDLGTRQGSTRELRLQPGPAFQSKSRQGSTHDLSTRLESQTDSSHELTSHKVLIYEPSAPSSAFESKSHQGSMSQLGTREGSIREHGLQPGPAIQSKSRQGSMHDLSTRLESQTDSSREPTSHQVLIYEPSAPSPAFESKSRQGSTCDLGTRQGELRLQPGPAFESKSRRGSTHDLTPAKPQPDSSHEPTVRQSYLNEPSAPQGSVHDEPIRRIPLHGSPLTPHR